MNYDDNNNNNNNTQDNGNDTNILPFRLVTQNIQGLNNETKQLQVLDMMKINNIHIMGLSETKLSHQRSKLIYKRNENYDAFFNNDGDNHSTGVGIIISKQYAKYVHRSKGYKGRVIYVDLFMKGKVKLRIIQVYMHANFNQKNDIIDLQNYIISLVTKSQQD